MKINVSNLSLLGQALLSYCVLAVLLLTLLFISFGRGEAAKPKCDGLLCSKQEDCGSKCTCSSSLGSLGRCAANDP